MAFLSGIYRRLDRFADVLGNRRSFSWRLKAGVHLKAVFTPLKIGQMEISCLHFKQYKNPPFITQINDLRCFMNFWVIFRYIWKEIIFLEGLVKLKEIRNVEDLVKFLN